jgi:hypothetical protein
MLLQKVDDRIYVSEKIDWMCRHSSMSIPINRLGLAQGIGLVMCHREALYFGLILELSALKSPLQVAASHLDTVLEKLKNILDNTGQSALQRYLYYPIVLISVLVVFSYNS